MSTRHTSTDDKEGCDNVGSEQHIVYNGPAALFVITQSATILINK